jgi:hypothetical protein
MLAITGDIVSLNHTPVGIFTPELITNPKFS